MVGTKLTIAAVLIISGVISCGGYGPPYATTALDWTVPNPWTSSGTYAGLSRYNAIELNRIHQGSGWGPIKYVDATAPSTRPDEVSVNPIDDYTWGAAAHSVRDGRCYLIVSSHDRDNPRYGHTFYGRLAAGAKCAGSAATLATATSMQPLPEG